MLFAMTTNVVDYVFCLMIIIGMVIVAVRARRNRRAMYHGWSPTHTYLKNMGKEYNRYYR